MADDPFFPCFEDPDVSEDDSTKILRSQLRSWYRPIDGAPAGAANIVIDAPNRRPAPVIAKHLEEAAEDLQFEIERRAREEAARLQPPPPAPVRYRLVRVIDGSS